MNLEESPSGRGSGSRMILRRDHVAGGVFVVGSTVLFALSGDLPFGTLSSPGAGMMPKLLLILLIGLGACLMLRAGESPPLADVAWTDFVHALTIVAAATVAIGAYTVIGFIPSMFLLLFALIHVVERRNIWRALAVSICVTFGCYYAFNTLLKAPLPRMPFWQ
jgi:hypothetical protein